MTPKWYDELGERVGHKPGSVFLADVQPKRQLSIWDACYQTPQAVLPGGTGKRPTVVPSTLLPTGVYRASASRRCWCALTTPLHPYPFQLSVTSYCLVTGNCSLVTEKGGIFLWHYPHDRSHWALPSKFGLSGARTFLRLCCFNTVCNCLRLLSPLIQFNRGWHSFDSN